MFRPTSVDLDRVSAGDLLRKATLRHRWKPCVAALGPMQFIPVPASPTGKSFEQIGTTRSVANSRAVGVKSANLLSRVFRGCYVDSVVSITIKWSA